ncbi:DUF362 domain-containing protein [Desulforamulus hydrothermalis]|uniref:Ferredoxin n=1 Tax=Desulforamulus hydrothermalis Lam5 = DSM 18033 TaxID=1121428 RepID=K8DZJ8_9FIRM|nr:DUF362 domain-containing protein [Desulforamulus hydrothermalis]CCO08537.1 conserved hypothetical protein [Desulforamulus hydrothermalis Lam5 = DSM 18033]SHH02660.1 Uncharacterized conserved protein, DUF362 family [Desulforamulus hydrothermalis Lam5 = DSM 18033]
MPEHATVAVAHCTGYELSQVSRSLDKLLQHLGGMPGFVKPGQVVAVKPNLIAKKKPEEAATTHPALVEAVVRMVQQAGGRPFIIDSPGGPASQGLLQAVYRATGMAAVARRTGCDLCLDTTEMTLAHPAGRAVKQLTVLKALAEADLIIGLPKLKTHCMTLYTGAVKLMYGAVPGLKKAQYHFNMQRLEQFSHLLIDINTLLPSCLTIMDAVVGMEGDGPTAGSPRQVGLLLASPSPYALDFVGAGLIGLKPTELPFIRLSMERRLCPPPGGINLVGEALPVLVPPFRLPAHRQVDFNVPGPLKGLLRKLQPRPVFSPELCIGCGECRRCCPAEAIQMVEGLPRVKLAECIRCFCCQELCPRRAVSVQQHWLGKKLLR